MMNNVCNNCGKTGHISNLCKLPIVSYGIVAFRMFKGKPEYLMIRRKDTFGYIDFIRGKYSLKNMDQIKDIIDEMSNDEKEKILTFSFEIGVSSEILIVSYTLRINDTFFIIL